MTSSRAPSVGRSIRGRNNRRLARGDGEYVADIARPGIVHMEVVRSPHAHARVVGINTAPALELGSTIDVITPEEIRRSTNPIPEGWDTEEAGARRVDWYALAQDRVRYVGEAVAAVIADSQWSARQAAALVDIDYEVLDPVTSIDEALDATGPRVEPSWDDNVLLLDGYEFGDPDSTLASASNKVSGHVSSQRISGTPIEPRGILAEYDRLTDQLTFWESTQQPHQVRTFLARALDISEHSVRVIQPHVGGAFGLKQPTSQEEVLVAFAARRLGQPVRWLESRAESLMVGGHARETFCQYEVAYEDDGNITALRVNLHADVGAPTAFLGWGMSVVTMYTLPTVYQIPNVSVNLRAVVTHKCPWTPYRGFGKDVASFIMDRVIERVAYELDIAGIDVRRRNFVPADAFPYPQASGAVLDSGDYEGLLDALLEKLDIDGFREIQKEARAEGRLLGIGIAQELTPEGVAMPGSVMNNGYDGATVRVVPTGEVVVVAGVTTPGTGNETALAQIAADSLGCSFESVSVIQGDTEICPWGLGNYSSRSIIIGGSAVAAACEELRAKIHTVAASMLDVDTESLAWEAGLLWVRDDAARSVSFGEVVERIYWHAFEAHADLIEPGLEVTRYFRIPNIYHQPERDGRFSVYPTWAYGMAGSIVELDSETGHVRLLRHVLVEDSGTLVNPLLAEANLHGGMTQGIGSTMFEMVAYDESGQLVTGSLMEYTIPTAVEIPRFEVSHTVTPSPFTPLGTKGVGESGLGSALGSICNAIEDAVPGRHMFIESLPVTPQAIWRALRDAELAPLSGGLGS